MRKAAPKKASPLERAETRAKIARANAAASEAKLRQQYIDAAASKLPEMFRGKPKGWPRSASRYYEAAATGNRHRTTRNLPPRAPWALLDRTARDSLRRQVQQTERNNLLCRGIINRYVDFIVGDGPAINVRSFDDGYNRDAKRLLTAWMEGSDPATVGRPNIRGMTRFVDDIREVVRAARLVDGDILAVRTFDERGYGTMQYIDAERLVNKGGSYADSETMCGGVEMNAVGLPIAYHVSGWQRNGLTLERGTYELPATTSKLIFNPVGFKTAQVRGEPQLQAALGLLDILNGYIESTALASEVATWLGAIFKSDRPEDLREMMAAATTDQPDRENTSQPQEVAFGPGFSHYCRPGEGVEQIKPEFPTTNFKDFTHAIIQIIGADVGLPLVVLMYVTEQMSWSNLRGVLAIAARGFDYTQDWLRCFIEETLKWKLSEFIARGLLPDVEGWDALAIKLPPSPAIDFGKEVEGYAKAVENNYMDEQMVCELLGTGNYEEIVARRGANRKLAEAAGVLPPTTPGAGVQGGGSGGTGNDGEDGAEMPDDGDDATAATTTGAPAEGKTVFLVGDKTLAYEMVRGVSSRDVPPESAKSVLVKMVGLSEADASGIIDPATLFEVPVAPAAPPPMPADPPTEGE